MIVESPPPTEVIVDLATGSPTAHIAEQLASSTGATGYRISPYSSRIILTILSDMTSERFVELVREQPDVLDAYPNERFTLASSMAVHPNDPCYIRTSHSK